MGVSLCIVQQAVLRSNSVDISEYQAWGEFDGFDPLESATQSHSKNRSQPVTPALNRSNTNLASEIAQLQALELPSESTPDRDRPIRSVLSPVERDLQRRQSSLDACEARSLEQGRPSIRSQASTVSITSIADEDDKTY